MNRRLITIAAGMLVAAAGWRIAAQRPKEPTPAPAKTTESGVIVAAGRVEPLSEEIKLGPQMDGVLKAVPVDEGDEVRRGQVVAVLENGEYGARVEIARASVAESEAGLARLRNGSRPEEKLEADALMREARAQLETAASERDRRRQILDRGAVSHSEFDLAERDWQTARQRLEAAEQRAAIVHQSTRVEDLQRGEAELANARARLQEAEALLEKTYIRASIDGRVLRRFRKAGESVTANGTTPIISLGDCRTLRVRADIDEADVARLRLGMSAYVKADAYGEHRFTGRVVQLGQALGRKNVRTDEPSERVDTKILETLIELDPGQTLPVGLRVDAYLKSE